MTHNKIMGQKVLRKHREEENKTTTQKPPNKPTKKFPLKVLIENHNYQYEDRTHQKDRKVNRLYRINLEKNHYSQ